MNPDEVAKLREENDQLVIRLMDSDYYKTKYEEQITKLSEVILKFNCGEPSQNEGAVDTAIRMLKVKYS